MNSKELLNSIVKTAQMGQIGIRSVMKGHLHKDIKKALQSQLSEYDKIETEAQRIAESKGWELDELNPVVKKMTDFMTRTRLSFSEPNSMAAAMMIQGNTRGLIKGYKNIHQCHCSDERITQLCEKLLSSEEANAKQMQGFL